MACRRYTGAEMVRVRTIRNSGLLHTGQGTRYGLTVSSAGMAVAPDHRHQEVVIALREGADPGVVAAHLRRHGLEVVALTAGLLATGEAGAVDAAFGAELRVPDALREHVESVAVVPPKRLH